MSKVSQVSKVQIYKVQIYMEESKIVDSIQRYIDEVLHTLGMLPWERIRETIDILLQVHAREGTIFTIGNGGSAATASHMACDLAKGTIVPGCRRFRVIALTDNLPLMTAWSNDLAYEDVFVEQLRGLFRPDDVLIAISGSGNSPNVLRAVEVARQMGGITIGLIGFEGGQLRELVDVPVVIPNQCMEQIEDIHVILGHLLSTVLREQLQQQLDGERIPLDEHVWRELALPVVSSS